MLVQDAHEAVGVEAVDGEAEMPDAGIAARAADGQELRAGAHPQNHRAGLPGRDGHAEQPLVPRERPRGVGHGDGRVVEGGDGNRRAALRERPRGQRRRAEGAGTRAATRGPGRAPPPVEGRPAASCLGASVSVSSSRNPAERQPRREKSARFPPKARDSLGAARIRMTARPPCCRTRLPGTAPYGAGAWRSGRKNSRRSSTSTAGCSIAAKWPPCSTSVQWVMLYEASAHRRGVMNSS